MPYRYAASPPFRSLMHILTYYWIIATLIYFAATATVTWASWSLDFSFAFVLGQLFIWLAIASIGCWAIVHWGLEREKIWWNTVGSSAIENQEAPFATKTTLPIQHQHDIQGVPTQTSQVLVP